MLVADTASIKDIRKSYDWTQEQMAHILGTSWVTISRWERGISEPSDRKGRPAKSSSNPAMANFPPTDLLQSGYAFRKLIYLVEKTKHGDFS